MTLFRILLVFGFSFAWYSAAAISVNIVVTRQPACTYGNGRLQATAYNGVPPYTYAWSTGATTQTLTGVQPGDYTVTVTDANMEQASAEITVTASDHGDFLSLGGVSDIFDYIGYGPCDASSYYKIGFMPDAAIMPGPPPYYVDGVELDSISYYIPDMGGYWQYYYGTTLVNPTYGSAYSVPFVDGNGCTGTYSLYIGYPVQWPTLSIVSIQGACVGTTSGSITIHSTGEGHQQGVQASFSPFDQDFEVYNTGGGPHNFTISGLAAGNYNLTQFMTGGSLLPSSGCSSSFGFNIPQLGAECGTLSGTVFIDHDQDCTQDPGDAGVPDAVLEVQPGPQYVITNQAGAYSIALVNGNYTLAQGDPSLLQLCPATSPAPFTLNDNPVVVNLADSSTVPLDLGVQMESTAMRPGFAGTYWGHVKNRSPWPSGEVTVTMEIDPALEYISASPAPTDVTGNTVTWQFSSFTAFHSKELNVSVQVPAGTPLGSLLNSLLTVENTLYDANTANNADAAAQEVVGSYDPNDKAGHTSTRFSDALYYIGTDQWLDYTIRFQNTGTDTAFTVVVRDTLDPDLNIASLEILGASHAFTPSFGSGRELVFTFNQILLPDSTTDLLGSQGYVAFRIKPHAGLVPGDELANTAAIYFDFNEPVITNTVTHVAEIGTGIAAEVNDASLVVVPNPATDIVRVQAIAGPVPTDWRVVAMDGRSLTVPVQQHGNWAELDVRSLAPGAYVVRSSEGLARFVKK